MQEVNLIARNHTAALLAPQASNYCLTARSSKKQELIFVAIEVPIPILSIFFNTVVLLAAGMQRKTLRRHNYVFSSVCSTLVSNILYTILAVWAAVANYLGIIADGVTDIDFHVKDFAEKMWVARNAMILCLLLAMCSNIGSLVFVLMDSTYFVGRTVSHGSIDKTKIVIKDKITGRYRIQLTKRAKVRLLIAISWIFPMVLVIASSATQWNCRSICCPPGYYDDDSCPVEHGCSRLLPPLAKSFLAIFLGVWLLEVFLMAWLLTHITLRFRKMAAEREEASRCNSGICTDPKQEGSPRRDIEQSQISCSEPTSPIEKSNEASCPPNRTSVSQPKPSISSETAMDNPVKKKVRSLRFVRKLNSKMKSMMSLTAIFFVFTLPLVLGIIVDFSTSAPMPGKNVFIVLSELSAFTYTMVCPMILLKFMPRLKMSVTLCLYKCCRICSK